MQRHLDKFSEIQRHLDKFSEIQRRNQFLEVIKISCSYVYKYQLLGTATFNPLYFEKKNTQERQYTYTVILSRVRVTIVVMAKQ